MNNPHKDTTLPDFLTIPYITESNRYLELRQDYLDAVLSDLKIITADAHLVIQSIKWRDIIFAPRDMFDSFEVESWEIPAQAPLMPLIVLFAGIEQMRQFYEEHHIPDKVFKDTIADINRNIGESKLRNGKYLIEPFVFNWLVKHMTNRVFHLGRLQFEAKRIEEDHVPIKTGDYVLNTHIPAGGKLPYNDILDAYRQAADLFQQLTPDIKYKGFICESWMLSPQLKEILDAESNLIKFLSDYEIYRKDDDESFYTYVYINKPNNLLDLPEDTTLQSAIKHHLLAGGKIESGCGFIPMSKIWKGGSG